MVEEVVSYDDRSVRMFKAFFVALGLFLAFLMLYKICSNRLESLRTIAESEDVTVITANERIRQLECLTRNIYWEAATEPFEGKVAVAQVTLNRLESGKFGNTLCGVVYQRNIIYEKVICQFSWVCDRPQKTRPVNSKYYAESEEVAKIVLLENFRLPGLKDALYYHANYVSPGWRKEKVATIGQHIFYRE